MSIKTFATYLIGGACATIVSYVLAYALAGGITRSAARRPDNGSRMTR